jgi:hypothetical protein
LDLFDHFVCRLEFAGIRQEQLDGLFRSKIKDTNYARCPEQKTGVDASD